MRRAVGSVGVVLAALISSHSAAWATSQPSLYLLARELLQRQEMSLRGVRLSELEQSGALLGMAKVIDAAEKETWLDKRNARSLTVYLLNGGPVAPVRKLLGSAVDLGDMKDVVKAMLAFAEGGSNAASALSKIDASRLEPVTGACVALAQAIATQSMPATALPHLRIAKLLAPGTMLDEAASRREVLMLLAHGQQKAAAQFAKRYFWRYGKSPFADDVASYLGSTLLPELLTTDQTAADAGRLLDELPGSVRRALLLDAAQKGLLSGKLDIAVHAGKLLKQPQSVASEHTYRERMYLAVAGALVGPDHELTDDLITMDRLHLDDTDRGVLDAALAVAAQVRAEIVDAGYQPEAQAQPSPAVARAEKSVLEADAALRETGP